MACKFSLALLFIVILKIVDAVDYCNIVWCNPRNSQTMCKYKNSYPAQACFQKGNLGGELTQNEKTTILNLHNQYRQKVANGNENRGDPGPQPRAMSMPNLSWDNELAAVAQRWADQCSYGHDSCRSVERFGVGQNIALSGTTGNVNSLVITELVTSWYNEVAYYDQHDVSKFTIGRAKNGKYDIGHYTQMVWAQTRSIGCGARSYYHDRYNWKYLVCNYGPAGNVLGRPVYIRV